MFCGVVEKNSLDKDMCFALCEVSVAKQVHRICWRSWEEEGKCNANGNGKDSFDDKHPSNRALA